jgi:peptidoglycan/xylan/chitin deacetylase (PgdA/CDA1 family)
MSATRIYMLVVAAAIAFGAHVFVAPPPVPVLLLHDVARDRSPVDFWTLSPERFAELVDAIDRVGYRGMTLEEADLYLDGRLPRDRAASAVLITVDDGPASSGELVAPALSRRGHSATFFLVSGWGPPKHLGPEAAKALARAGHGVGAHGMTHAGLAPDPKASADAERARIAGELTGAKKALERVLERPVTSIAYPKGEFGEVTKAEARAAGYRMAFTTDLGYLTRGADRLELPRFQLNWDTPIGWIEDYLTAPRRERTRTLYLVGAVALLGLVGAAFSSRTRAA